MVFWKTLLGRKMAHLVKSQLLYLQMSMLKVDSAFVQAILSMQMTVLYIQWYIHCLQMSFEINPFEFYMSIKDLNFLDKINLLQNLLCTPRSFCVTTLGPFGEVGAKYPVHTFCQNI